MIPKGCLLFAVVGTLSAQQPTSDYAASANLHIRLFANVLRDSVWPNPRSSSVGRTSPSPTERPQLSFARPSLVMLNALPLTSNGKVSRKALLAMEGPRAETGAAYAAPRGAVEPMIAAVWQAALKVESVGSARQFLGPRRAFASHGAGARPASRTATAGHPARHIVGVQTISSFARYLGQEQNGKHLLQQSQDRAMKQRALLSCQRRSAKGLRPGA